MGDLPSQILELSSDSSFASTTERDRHTSPISPTPIRHRAIRRAPRAAISRQVVPPSPAQSPVSLPDEPEKSPYKAVRRVQSDRFDQVEYERNVALLASEEDTGRGYYTSEDGSSEAWSARGRAGQRVLLMDEEQRVIRRVVDRSVLLEELLREPTPPRRPTQPFRFAPRLPPTPHINRVSRRPTLPTIASSRMMHRHTTNTGTPVTPERSSLSTSRSTRTPIDTPPSDPFATLAGSSPQQDEGDEGRCDACGRDQNQGRKMRMMPCAHIVCSTCFSSSISAVSVTHGPSRCTTCLALVVSFEPVKGFSIQHHTPQSDQEAASPPTTPPSNGVRSSTDTAVEDDGSGKTILLRIDNVAWDITPAVVESFLPPDVFPATHPSPVHILLDRQDGRTKDFLYVEVRSLEAARLVLKTRQNTLMPCGPASAGRKRFVTISLTTHKELLDELRPKTAAELHALLALCQTSILSPSPTLSAQRSYVGYNGIAHFVKDRHGPFHALMSILCHLSGKNSPAYWDLFHVTSGAMAALANVVTFRNTLPPNSAGIDSQTMHADQDLLDKLRYLFQTRFCLTPISSPA
ncbi:uncharacterized protein MKK02DRAFT_40145 [Dioszegia hungarica]|uniref:RING-type domain-containing protein n=1 Tax=Dioszegia hungarica TaxID=4972 RepID=A0AA38HDM8_9TREE|nr:uncharacterized protein MKK02DRAFT_40145 [Dioszegia hungarica]KAI9639818.1 hypothetical protein MKK02DRAFT_40145 [Dioszegia hungarica]